MRERPLIDLLDYWDAEPDEAPHYTGETHDGNFEALWVYETEDEDGNDVVAWVSRVEFQDDKFIVEFYEDIMERERHGDQSVDEEGNPYYTEWGQEYSVETVAFDKRRALLFVRDIISGKLKRHVEKTKEGWLRSMTWEHAVATPVMRRTKLPRKKEELARWMHAMGGAAMHLTGGTGDYSESLPDAFYSYEYEKRQK